MTLVLKKDLFKVVAEFVNSVPSENCTITMWNDGHGITAIASYKDKDEYKNVSKFLSVENDT